MVGDDAQRRKFGRLFIGLGLTLLALKIVVSSSLPLRESPALVYILGLLEKEALVTIFLAALLTWAAHSSLAMVLLFSGLAASGTVPLGMLPALVLGANVGGGLAPYMATAGQPPAARRPALGNLLMRVIGTALCVPLLPYISQLLTEHQYAVNRAAIDVHTAFNFAVAIVFMPLLSLIDAITRKILPDSEDPESLSPKYISSEALDTPGIAIASATREVLRLSDAVGKMLADSIAVFTTSDPKLIKSTANADDVVDNLYEAIKLYVTELSKQQLDDSDDARCREILLFATNLEHIGDIIDKNLMGLAQKRIKHKLAFSKEGLSELQNFHKKVSENFQLACNLFITKDANLARRLIEEKHALRDLEGLAAENHYNRIRQGRVESIETSAIHLDVLRDLKRINSHIAALAYPTVAGRVAA